MEASATRRRPKFQTGFWRPKLQPRSKRWIKRASLGASHRLLEQRATINQATTKRGPDATVT
jgi:hypothetical protein